MDVKGMEYGNVKGVVNTPVRLWGQWKADGVLAKWATVSFLRNLRSMDFGF
jgi:hypothetical protein